MFVYLFLFAILTGYLFLTFDSKLADVQSIKIFNNFLFLYITLYFILLGGFRWLTGTDWNAYYDFFARNNTWKDFYNGKFELLFSLLNYFVKSITTDYSAYLTVFAILVIGIKAYGIKKIAVCPALVLFLYFCYYCADIMAVRQGLSVSLLILSLVFIISKRKKEWLFLTLLATLIHNTSIIWFFSYKVYWWNLKRKNAIILLIFSFFAGLHSIDVLSDVLSRIESYLPQNLRIIAKLVAYIKWIPHTLSASASIAILIKSFMFLPLFIICDKKEKNRDSHFSGLLNLWFFGRFLTLLFMSINSFQRFAVSYSFSEIFLLAYLLRITNKNYMKSLILLILILYGGYKLYFYLNGYRDLFIPYYSIFNYQNRVMY